ncbi:MAG: DUF2735 domain-containing protein [Hyphomicrobium sp.]|jgi:hypothetical protein
MNPQQQRPTAKIYTFPAGGRPPTSRKREATTLTYLPLRAEAIERAPKIVCGSSWYHEAAVDEARGR